MLYGRVKFFSEKNHFGFIVEDNTSVEYYVHAKDLLDSIIENDAVEFEIEDRKKGKVAVRVRKKK